MNLRDAAIDLEIKRNKRRRVFCLILCYISLLDGIYKAYNGIVWWAIIHALAAICWYRIYAVARDTIYFLQKEKEKKSTES